MAWPSWLKGNIFLRHFRELHLGLKAGWIGPDMSLITAKTGTLNLGKVS